MKKGFLIVLAIIFMLAAGNLLRGQDEGIIRGVVMEGRLGFFRPMQFADSFRAVFDSAGGMVLGAGVRVELPKNIYVEGALDYFNKDGYRVYVAGTKAVRTDIDTSISIIPFTFTGGYRFKLKPSLIPYVGGGFGRYYFKQKDTVTELKGESSFKAHTGYHLLGGVEFRADRPISFAGELKWNTVPGAIGEGGVSKYYEEDNIGGFSISFKVLFRLK